jgi:hypothetical protein
MMTPTLVFRDLTDMGKLFTVEMASGNYTLKKYNFHLRVWPNSNPGYERLLGVPLLAVEIGEL